MMACSQLIYPITQFGKMGKVHSIFDRSFNIIVNGQLIHIGCYKQYISSFGTYVDRDSYERIKPYLQVGNNVRVSDGSLTFYSTKGVYKLDIEIEPIDLKVHQIILEDSELAMRNLTYLRESINKNINISQIGLENNADLQIVFSKLSSSKEVEWQEIVHYLIGRGKGLTPSGDDIMVAYLFTMLLYCPQRALALCKTMLNMKLSTTDISLAYLIACTKGFVSSPIYRLYETLKTQSQPEDVEKAIENIKMIGHTSGKDMVFGIRLGVNYFWNNLNIRREKNG